MNEDLVKSQITKYCKKLKESGEKIYLERRQALGIGYKLGLPDIWLVYNGHHIEVELKKPGGKRSATQIKWETWFKDIGVEYAMIDNLNDFKKLLDKFK